MLRTLVTGGAGFIGSHVIRRFLKEYSSYHIINLDKLTYAGNLENLRDVEDFENYTFIKGDICDEVLVAHIFSQYAIDGVIHLAAESHVDRSISDPMAFIRTNVLGTAVLLNAARHSWGEELENKLFYHVSTDEVYGESKTDEPFTEATGVLRPTNPYSASKAAAEMIVMSYIESFNMNIKILRCNNVYGPNQYPEKLIPKFVRLLKNDEKCTIHGVNSAKVRRAFMHVDDVIDAVETVWKKGKAGEVYNIASDDEMSVMDVTQLIIKTIKDTEDYDAWIDYVEDRPFNDQRYHICAKKLKELGWTQKKTREDLINFLKY